MAPMNPIMRITGAFGRESFGRYGAAICAVWLSSYIEA